MRLYTKDDIIEVGRLARSYFKGYRVQVTGKPGRVTLKVERLDDETKRAEVWVVQASGIMPEPLEAFERMRLELVALQETGKL